MLFNSLPFLFFFPAVTISYFLCPYALRWALLLLASCIFYMWFIPSYLLILFLLIIIDYGMGILIEEARLKGGHARRYLIVSIAATCLVLVIFKYFNFFSANLSALAGFFDLHYPAKIINLVLPIGLSFHTLQSLSYVIEVYRGRVKAERHLGIYALYVMFYPQLVAGPIERPYNLIPQLREKHDVDYQRITDALKLMAWGMFKKVVIADRMAVLVNQVYGDVHSYQGPQFVIAAIFFAIQDYCDFSGYSDIAIGSAKAMGFDLTNNFNFPFFSRSIAEYATRWNITFFSWIKDYIYIPLTQGYVHCNRLIAVLIAFLFSGLWHGANWTFIFSFEILGSYIVLSRMTRGIREKICDFVRLDRSNIFYKIWQMFACFFLLSFALIPYRAKDLKEGFYVISQLTHGWARGLFSNIYTTLGFKQEWWMLSGVLIVVLLTMDLLQNNARGRFVFAQYPAWVRWAYYYSLVLAMVFWGNYGQNQFLYFQF